MDALSPGQIRVHKKNGESYVAPLINKDNIVRMLSDEIARIEHYKPAKPAVAPQAEPTSQDDTEAPSTQEKTKQSLLGGILKDNKITAGELFGWIEKSESLGDIEIVLKGETRKTVKAAAKQRINELI